MQLQEETFNYSMRDLVRAPHSWCREHACVSPLSSSPLLRVCRQDIEGQALQRELDDVSAELLLASNERDALKLQLSVEVRGGRVEHMTSPPTHPAVPLGVSLLCADCCQGG